MKTQLTIAITLACIGIAQACLTLMVGGIFKKSYRKLLADLTATEEEFGVANWFHREDPGGYRLDKVAAVSDTASTVTSQCVSLVVTALGAAALAWVAWASGRRIGWFIGCLVIVIAGLALCWVLLFRLDKEKLLTFGMHLRGDKPWWKRTLSLNAAGPYLAFQFLAVVYAAVVGVVF